MNEEKNVEKSIVQVINVSKSFQISSPSKSATFFIKSFFASQKEEIKAVDNLSFSIYSGEAVGLIGVNGAGKSTTIKLLAGILTPTKGSIYIHDIIPHKYRQKNAHNIGVVFGQRSSLNWDLPAKESFRLFKHIYSIDDDIFKKNLSLFHEILEIGPLLDTPVRQLSLGQRMRVNLASAFLHDPSVLLLDEPTIGLDIFAKSKMCDFLSLLASKKNRSIILASHDLSDIEDICNRIILINRGKKIYDGSIIQLKDSIKYQRQITLTCSNDPTMLAQDPFFESLNCPNYSIMKNKFSFHIKNDENLIPIILTYYVKKKIVKDISIDDLNLEGVIKQYVHAK